MENCHIYEKYVSSLSLCRFKTSSKIFYWPFQCGASFEYLCLVFLMISRLFIDERADLLVLVCDVYCIYFLSFPCGILGQAR